MKRVLLVAVILLCVLLVVWGILASRKPSITHIGSADQQAVSVEGVITNQDGKPVSGVKLEVTLGGHGGGTSDRQGKYKVSWLPESSPADGITYLIARHRKRDLAAAVELRPDMPKLDIQLQPAVSVTGLVTDFNDKALRGAKVHLLFWSDKFGTMLSASATKTNRKGRFEIKTVPFGHKYSVIAEAEGFGRDSIEIYSDDAVKDRLDIGSRRLAVADQTVSGVVYDANDWPVPNAEIYAYGDGQPFRRGIRTNGQGRFVIEGVCEGAIQIYAHARDRSPVEYGHVGTVSGATDVKIVLKKSSSTQDTQVQSLSLEGKSLPSLNGIAIDFAPERAKEKMILMCFWDMEQRPSRHCIIQLVKQAEMLKQKDVIVVAVQASKVDENKLKEWVKSNNIPFPVGMIQEDVEKTKFTWGVKSLPWLILTDKEHIVQAEGFGINELYDKIIALREE